MCTVCYNMGILSLNTHPLHSMYTRSFHQILRFRWKNRRQRPFFVVGDDDEGFHILSSQWSPLRLITNTSLISKSRFVFECHSRSSHIHRLESRFIPPRLFFFGLLTIALRRETDNCYRFLPFTVRSFSSSSTPSVHNSQSLDTQDSHFPIEKSSSREKERILRIWVHTVCSSNSSPVQL